MPASWGWPAGARPTGSPPSPRITRSTGDPAPLHSPEQLAAEEREQRIVSEALRAEAAEHIALTGRRPQFARSLDAALDVLAEAIVRRDGSISRRDWELRAQLDKRTLHRVRDFAAERGIIYRAHRYAGGADDCDAWRPGPATAARIERLRETSPTRWDTPLHARAGVQARLGYAPATAASNGCGGCAASWPPMPRRLGKPLRAPSIRRPRRCTVCGTNAAGGPASPRQDERRTMRRALLGRMHRTELSAWFDWLGRRADIVAVVERIVADAARAYGEQLLPPAAGSAPAAARAAERREVAA